MCAIWICEEVMRAFSGWRCIPKARSMWNKKCGVAVAWGCCGCWCCSVSGACKHPGLPAGVVTVKAAGVGSEVWLRLQVWLPRGELGGARGPPCRRACCCKWETVWEGQLAAGLCSLRWKIKKKFIPMARLENWKKFHKPCMLARLTLVALDVILEEVRIVIFSKWQVETVYLNMHLKYSFLHKVLKEKLK